MILSLVSQADLNTWSALKKTFVNIVVAIQGLAPA